MRRRIGPIPIARAIAALLGLAAVFCCAPDLAANTCHIAERPLFGLQTHPADRPATVPATDATIDREHHDPVVIPRPCPNDAPERSPTTRVPVGASVAGGMLAPAVESCRFLVPSSHRSPPRTRDGRIDHPPRHPG